MKKVLVKLIRVVSWIVIVLNIIGTVALFYVVNDFGLLGIVLQKWQENPLNFSDYDVMAINRTIIFLVIPILILAFVKTDKKKQV